MRVYVNFVLNVMFGVYGYLRDLSDVGMSSTRPHHPGWETLNYCELSQHESQNDDSNSAGTLLK